MTISDEKSSPALPPTADGGADPRGAGVYGASTSHGGAGYLDMIDAMRQFLDSVAGARPEPEILSHLTDDLRRWTRTLDQYRVPEAEQVFYRRRDQPDRGQTLTPAYVIEESDPQHMTGRVTFGRYFLGGGGAAHGGVIALLFDQILGQLDNPDGRAQIRTAYLTVSYRAPAPVETGLTFTVTLDREEGRKRFVRGALLHGTTVCADAEALYITVRPDPS